MELIREAEKNNIEINLGRYLETIYSRRTFVMQTFLTYY